MVSYRQASTARFNIRGGPAADKDHQRISVRINVNSSNQQP